MTERVALVTGASRGLGLALASALADEGWRLVIDARDAHLLQKAAAVLPAVAVPGDVADPAHQADLAAEVTRLGRLDLLVNNASTLGPSPLPPLADYPIDELNGVYQVNVLAPLALTQRLLPALAATGGRLVNVSSDAAAEPYPGWGGYGSA